MRDYKIEDLSVDPELKIITRLRCENFSRTILFLSIKFEENDEVYTTDLKRFLGTSETYAYNLLRDLYHFGLIQKIKVNSNLIIWKPVFNSKNPLINKYIERAKKTLGIGVKK